MVEFHPTNPPTRFLLAAVDVMTALDLHPVAVTSPVNFPAKPPRSHPAPEIVTMSEALSVEQVESWKYRLHVLPER